MKTIKLFCVSAIMVVAGLFTSCTDYQDEIDALDYRVTILENLVSKTNQNIDALQTIAEAAVDGWVIKGMAELPSTGAYDAGGYIINFSKIDPETGELSDDPEDNKTVTVYNGLNGRNGVDGQDGKDGEDASAPNISLQYDPDDGNYYWTIDGAWLRTPDGNRIRVNGKDGKDGKDGEDGADGVSTAPILNINDNGEWIISYDNGLTWTIMTDDDGNPLKATGKDGKDGLDGKDAATIIKEVIIKVDTEGNRYIVLVIAGGGGNGEDLEVAIPMKDMQ